jgi:hypothetical protein
MSKKLAAANIYLRDAATRDSGLWASAKTSSAIEGIRQPFAHKRRAAVFPSAQAFIEHWKQRFSRSAR